jgi:hypothetical protein
LIKALWVAARLSSVVVGVVGVVGVILIFSKSGFYPRARVFYDIGSIAYLYFMK